MRLVSGNRAGTEIAVDGGVATIGRALDCTVVLDERDVSRKHAKIESTPDGLLVTDLGSSTGVWIGSTEVKSQLIRPGDRVRLGEQVLLECALVGAASVAAQPVDDPFSTRFIPAADLAAIAPPACMLRLPQQNVRRSNTHRQVCCRPRLSRVQVARRACKL